MGTTDEVRVVEHATCAFCGCVCDDIDLTVEGSRITKAKNACVLGKAWFLDHQGDETRPEAFIEGSPASTEEVIAEAARLLATSRYPIVYGLSHTTSEAQRVAV